MHLLKHVDELLAPFAGQVIETTRNMKCKFLNCIWNKAKETFQKGTYLAQTIHHPQEPDYDSTPTDIL